MTNQATRIVIAGYQADTETVERGLFHSEPACRVAALGASRRLGQLTAAKLKPFFDDPDIDVRYRAIELSHRLSSADQLVDLLTDSLENPDLAEVAAFALGEIETNDAKAIEALRRQAIDHSDPLCREAAVAALGAIGTALDVILAATEDKATVRRRAVLSLASFDGPDVDAALQKASQDRDWQVRQAAEDLSE